MRVNRLLIGALLMVVPFLFIYSNGIEPIRLAKLAGVSILGSIGIGLFVSRSINRALGACVAWAGISMALTGMGAAQENFFVSVVVTVAACSFAVGSSSRQSVFYLKMLVIMTYIQAGYSLLQMAGLDSLFIYFEGHEIVPVGFMGQQTILGPLVACGVVGALSLGGRFLLLLPVMIASIVFCNSSFTYLSLIAGLSVIYFDFIKKNSLAVLLATAMAIIVSPLLFKDQINTLLMDNGRFVMWQETISIYENKFSFWQQLTGVGGGGFAAVFHKMQSEFLTRMSGYFLEAHNDYLQVLFEFGFVGVALVFWLLVECFKYGIAAWKSSSVDRSWFAILVCILFNSLGNFPMRIQPHGAIALLAFILIATKGKSPIYLCKENPHGSR